MTTLEYPFKKIHELRPHLADSVDASWAYDEATSAILREVLRECELEPYKATWEQDLILIFVYTARHPGLVPNLLPHRNSPAICKLHVTIVPFGSSS